MLLAWVLLFALIATCAVIWVQVRIARLSAAQPDGEVWWHEFDASRYHVLPRLLGESDLASAAKSDAGISKKIRAIRKRAFLGYLDEMQQDFKRLETMGRMIVLSGTASAEFQRDLMAASLRFTRLLFMVRVQYHLRSLGLGTVDTQALVESFDRFVVVCQPVAVPQPA